MASVLETLFQVADTLHLELIRFLFDRACQPYMVFIRSWLYLATVKDPFGEFFVKAVPSTNSKMRPGKTREQDALSSYEVRVHHLHPSCSFLFCISLVDSLIHLYFFHVTY